MSDSTHKTHARDSRGPRAVGRSERRECAEGDSKHRSSKHSSSRSSKPESSGGRRESSSSHSHPSVSEKPTFEMDVIGQPQRNVIFGTTVETSVMVSLRVPSPDLIAHYKSLDINKLMGVVSLVADSRNGERVAIECGTLTGQKMFDSCHPIPEEYAGTLARNQPCRLSLGYFTFPSLLIRQPGTYRLRITLMKMSSSGGSANMLSVDSDTTKVERRATGAGSKHQRS
ncbi:hypothetical protein DOTSEDRAFT_129021 [Dothistroma septosporum NZE10]|uniref:Velvet domain-containing protein n=1 Tax=Dothistroma septosporum (strain NZE10 / CBS 128990) TaxID=675120 RepID=N1PRM6_DOTSN|nr:hypothetical protein DOTSEDRAFT_129021 [Dothistroma septosporum NZE10]